MELMTTKKGPTLKPGAESLYRRTEKAPALPPWLPGAGAEEEVRDLPDAPPVLLRRPAADGPVPLIPLSAFGGDWVLRWRGSLDQQRSPKVWARSSQGVPFSSRA